MVLFGAGRQTVVNYLFEGTCSVTRCAAGAGPSAGPQRAGRSGQRRPSMTMFESMFVGMLERRLLVGRM